MKHLTESRQADGIGRSGRTRRLTSTVSRGQRGFTLVELMVGVLLGMLTVVIISQVFAVSESQKRTTTSGSDAQVSGALALYALQRDIQMSGYGLAAVADSLGCEVRFKYGAATADKFTLTPVVVSDDAAVSGSQTLRVLRSTKSTFSVPLLITENHPQDGTYFVVQSSVGVNSGDVIIAVPAAYSSTAWCTVLQAKPDGATALTSTQIPHVADATTAPWNQIAANSIFPAGGYAKDDHLVNLGGISLVEYSVNPTTNTLQMKSLDPGTGAWVTQDVQSQVVALRVLYGKDTDADGAVDKYDVTTPTTNAEWRQVLAVRLVVVAQSGNYERDVVTSNKPLIDLGTTVTNVTDAQDCHGDHKCIEISLDRLGDWNHYRYKVFDTVVPLRNVLWSS